MHYKSFNEAWRCIVDQLLFTGEDVTDTTELRGDLISFPICRSILASPGRKLSYQFMYREAWWILSGQNKLCLLTDLAPQYANYSDDGLRLAGAYGPKIVDQLSWIVQKLVADQTTRQAVLTIWRERPGESKDIPCTISAQFMIRAGALDIFVNMRSSDVWLGLPYDVFTFAMIACQVALELKVAGVGVALGTFYQYAASRHMYLKNCKAAAECLTIASAEEQYIDIQQLWDVVQQGCSLEGLLGDQSYNHPDSTINALLPWLNL